MNSNDSNVDASNIYRLDGKVPIGKAIPFGLQHILAMFVSNVTPIILLAGVAMYNGVAFDNITAAHLVQNCMIIAGIGTLIQLYPLWKIGSGLPIVMGISFTFLSALMVIAQEDYGIAVGAIIVGGVIEGLLGLTAKFWAKFITPVVAGCVVTSIGVSLLNVGMSSFAQSSSYEIGSWQNLLVGLITIVICILTQTLGKGFIKQLNLLVGLLVGYIVSIAFGMVDFASIGNTINELGWIALPQMFAYKPVFKLGPIISITLVFLVSAVETIGDSSAICKGGLKRDIKNNEISGSVACDGFISAISGGVFGCSPITSFSQNVGICNMTGVVNRFTVMCGAVIMIAAGLFPAIGAILTSVPNCVLGGCTTMLFGSIAIAGMNMLHDAGFNQKNTIITATSLSIGIGVTQVDGFFSHLPAAVGDIFAGNSVAGVFVVSLLLSLIIPESVNKEN
ncbi:nucleobase:cation symporter-2, NCS2 family [Acetitomaculum ruminis DSM 5522]|uniref:Nucleobase:cation symporter-2, NCS2 family n=1 Tax=Acetitomaculum ruminis DSM 5522 TaxID=1120918 RepID=A0A1I1A8K8_9FIRM|nr:solute carrier family 23 protein [Acetitomaculum ruminis]SFB32780.1 nucleobase:cation symporter-2, NCS2 family [Acetitomaculum ruminis DSM 5522]